MWESGLYVPLSVPPVAAFTADRTAVCPGETIVFTDHSTNSIAQWHWNFPGGIPAISSQQNPSVTYYTPGVYPVSLVAYNIWGTDTVVQTSFITVLSRLHNRGLLPKALKRAGFLPLTGNYSILITALPGNRLEE